MKIKALSFLITLMTLSALTGFRQEASSEYTAVYLDQMARLNQAMNDLRVEGDLNERSETDWRQKLREARLEMKSADLWLRYMAPIHYKKIHSPLPVEWETEVFEKFEAPYRRDGAGLILAEAHLDEGGSFHELDSFIDPAIKALEVYTSDSMMAFISDRHHFLLANRLFLLNVAAIYTTGFECPNPDRIIPELKYMLANSKKIYAAYNATWPAHPLTDEYLLTYDKTLEFVDGQSTDPSIFDHFTLIRDHVNPLFRMNQEMIRAYGVRSMSFNDYSLNDDCSSIFDKTLYEGQNAAGLFASVKDEEVLKDIKSIGRKLFFDPILSGNNQRSCASCHQPDKLLGDGIKYNLHFSGRDVLSRNTPTLVNAIHNHLLHVDGKHISPQAQAMGVIANMDEMAGQKEEVLSKVMSCKEYKKAFNGFLQYSRGSKEVSFSHLVSALTMFYADFSMGRSPFDQAVDMETEPADDVVRGFNIFMSKGQCATCHFVPQFNGVKPPYVGSEFEVIGVPVDTAFTALSPDSGRYHILREPEMVNAFRTGSIRNIEFTGPYMHNGVFETLEQVVDFYNDGGGAGRGLDVPNQTLPADPLDLTDQEKQDLISFMKALSEEIGMPEPPSGLPSSSNSDLNSRVVGGEY